MNFLRTLTLPRWLDWFVVVTAFVALCFLVWHGMTTDSAYFDEGYSAYLAHLSVPEIAYYTSLDVHPPLYYVLLHGWQGLFGSSMGTLRMMSLVLAGAVIVLAFLIIRRGFGRLPSVIAIWFLTLSPLFVRYSTAARMYMLALAISLGATYILMRLHNEHRQKQRRVLWVIYGVLVTLGMWTNYFTALMWVCHGAWLLYEACRLQCRFSFKLLPKGWLAAVGLAIILYLPWIPLVFNTYRYIQDNGFWVPPVSIDTLSSTATISTVFMSANTTQGWLAVFVSIWIAMAIWLVRRTYKGIGQAQQRWLRLLLWCGFGPIILLFLCSLKPFQPAYTYRYVLAGICFLMLAIGVSISLVHMKKHVVPVRAILTTFVVGVLLIGTLQAALQGNRNLDTGTKAMVSQVIAKVNIADSETAPILAYSPYTYYAAWAYSTSKHTIYYSLTDSIGQVGATRGLYDMPTYGVKDIGAFGVSHPRIWILAEDKTTAAKPPLSGWVKTRELSVVDPATQMTGAFATEYSAP